MFAGPLKHAGFPITKGVRNILVLFLYVEGFHYGPRLAAACKQCCAASSASRVDAAADHSSGSAGRGSDADGDSSVRASGDKEGGFVVYRQTVELVNMLERAPVDDLQRDDDQ